MADTITPAAQALARKILRNPERHPAHRHYWAWCTLKALSGRPVNHRRLNRPVAG
jgi:hypothetical protein